MSLTTRQLADRQLGIGASEAAASIGLSRYKSQLALYLEKTEGVEFQEPDEPQVRLRLKGGQALEPVILDEFELQTRLRVTDRQLRVHDPQHPWRWATLDGRASDGALVEAKKTEITTAVWGEGDEDIPDDYYCQAQQGMACAAAERVYVPVLLPRWEFALYVVRRDEEFIELMTARQRAFMQRLVNRDPPPPSSLDDAKLMWPKHTPLKSISVDTEVVGLAQALANLKAQIKRAETEKETLELQLKSVMGDAEEMKGRPGRIATWKNNRPSMKFDEDAFAIDQPTLWKQYLKEKPGARVFLLKLKSENGDIR